MAPLVVLLAVTALARAAGALGVGHVASWPGAIAVGLAAMFAMTGSTHFVPARRAGYVAMVPPWLRHPRTLVAITGALELAGAVALLVPPAWGPFRVMGAWGLAGLLVAMFPANVHAARSPRCPTTPLPARTIIQCVFVGAALVVALGS